MHDMAEKPSWRDCLAKPSKPALSFKIDPNAVDGLHVGRGGGDDDRRAGIDQIPRFAFAHCG